MPLNLAKITRSRMLPAMILTAVIGFTLTFAFASKVKRDEIKALQTDFNISADNRINALQSFIDSNLTNLISVQSFYAASDYVSREEFEIFSSHLSKNYQGIQAFEWLPRISHSKRKTFEELSRRETDSKFRVYDFKNNQAVAAGTRKEYYPVFYSVPPEPNQSVLGRDYASEPEKNSAMQRASEFNRFAATRAIKLRRLSGKTDNPYGFIVFAPIFKNKKPVQTLEQRRQNLAGYAAAVFHTEKLLTSIFSHLYFHNMSFEIYSETENKDKTLLYRSTDKVPSRASKFEFQEFVNIADQKWLIVAKSLAPFETYSQRASRLVQITGCLLTFILLLVLINLKQIKKQEALKIISLHDELTGLYNRRGFLTLAQEQLKIAARKKTDYLMLFADLDGLKIINDTYGHKEGDLAIQNTAKILKKTFRTSDILARIGGDEFAIFAVDAGREKSSVLLAHLQENLNVYNAKHWHPYSLSLSVGSVFLPMQNHPTVEQILEEADRAMYQMKKNRQPKHPIPKGH